MKSFRRSVAGFTVIELMAVVVVLGVLSAIALPSFQSLVRSHQVKNASFDLYSTLVLARSEAIKRNDSASFNIVDYGSGKIGWTVSIGGQTLRTQGEVSGVVWTLVPADLTAITFLQNGRVTSAPSFQLDDIAGSSLNVRCVKLGLSGMPQTSKGACS